MRKIIINLTLNINMLINLIYQYFLQLIIHLNHQFDSNKRKLINKMQYKDSIRILIF